MRKFGGWWPIRLQIADFLSIFACSASDLTPSEKSSISTNRKSTTRFPITLRWTSYVVPKPPNDLQRHSNSPYFAFLSPNSIALLANHVTVVEDRPIMSAKYCLPVPVFHCWPKLTHPAARSLSDSGATCL